VDKVLSLLLSFAPVNCFAVLRKVAKFLTGHVFYCQER